MKVLGLPSLHFYRLLTMSFISFKSGQILIPLPRFEFSPGFTIQMGLDPPAFSTSRFLLW